MTETSFQAGNALHNDLSSDEQNVVSELCTRITTVAKGGRKNRTKEEVDAILNFWWKLQSYRDWWLWKDLRLGKADETLSEDEIKQVKRKCGCMIISITSHAATVKRS